MNKINERNKKLQYNDYVVELGFIEIPIDTQKVRSDKIIAILVDNAIKIARNNLVP